MFQRYGGRGFREVLSNVFFVPASWILAFYTLPLAVLLAFTWHNSKPQYHGMDWLMVGLLTYPGCGWQYVFSDRDFVSMPIGALVGLALNTSALCVLAWLFSRIFGGRD
jgi:hypothetical protein